MVDKPIEKKQDIQHIHEINVEDILNFIKEKMNHGVSYIDCILSYAEEYNIDIEVVGEIVRDSPILMSNVYEEAEGLNFEQFTSLTIRLSYWKKIGVRGSEQVIF